MKLTAREFLKNKRIITTINGIDRDMDSIEGLEVLLEDFYQAKIQNIEKKTVIQEPDQKNVDYTNVSPASITGEASEAGQALGELALASTSQDGNLCPFCDAKAFYQTKQPDSTYMCVNRHTWKRTK